jgi:hypothetical protein
MTLLNRTAYAAAWALSLYVVAGAANDTKDILRAQAGRTVPQCALISVVRPLCR